jgi:hypothetical protein
MKKESKVIIPPPNITCPYDGPILEFYKNHYEAVFLILSPFIALKNSKNSPFKEDKDWPSKKVISETCKKVSWSKILQISKIENLKKLDNTLREYIGATKTKDLDSTNKLRKTISTLGVIPPPEGFFQDLLIDDMMNGLKALGFKKIIIGDEFGSEKRETNVDEILNNHIELFAGENNIYTPNKEILFSVHWDSCFTLLCSKKKIIENFLKVSKLEGFYCTSKTSVYWGLDK